MDEWNTMQWNESRRSTCSQVHAIAWQTCSFVFGGDGVVLGDGPDFGLLTHGANGYWVTETTASIPQSWSSLAAQKHQHLVFELVQLQFIVYLKLSNVGPTCWLHRSMHCFYLAGSFTWTTSRCFNTQWKRMLWWFAEYLFCIYIY